MTVLKWGMANASNPLHRPEHGSLSSDELRQKYRTSDSPVERQAIALTIIRRGHYGHGSKSANEKGT